jgi:glycopeptide antibiotics resistance protein
MKIKWNEEYFWLFIFAVCFISYQLVQDHLRPSYEGKNAIIIYLLGVAPNFFPAIGIPALFVVLIPHLKSKTSNYKWLKEKVNITANIISLIGLISWEFTQTITSRGRFDWNDVVFTLFGALVFQIIWIVVHQKTQKTTNKF